jgi:hypothetical protein
VIGEKKVFEARSKGVALVDGCLYVQTDGTKPNRDWCKYGERAEVAIEPGDYPDLLDLRFAIGLRVHVEGTDAQRVDQVAAAFAAAKAGRVMTTVFKHIGGRFEVARLTDTEGIATWPA